MNAAYKAEDPGLFVNYGPISWLPNFSNFFEKVMYNCLVQNKKQNKYIVFKSRQTKLNYNVSGFANQSLKESNVTKFLDVYLDQRLNLETSYNLASYTNKSLDQLA